MRRIRRAVSVLPAVLLCAAVSRAEPDLLSPAERDIVSRLETREPQMLAELESWVAMNSGSANQAGLQAMANQLEQDLGALGFETRQQQLDPVEFPGLEPRPAGPIVIGSLGPDPAPVRFLLVGHYDTVFEPDHPFSASKGLGERDGRLRGPGVADMKGGLLVMFEVLRALRASGDLARARWTVLLNGDEETGSLGSRDWIEREARRADYGVGFEAAREAGGRGGSRRGGGQCSLSVRGVAAHAGSAHRRGHSAILELARKVVMIEALTDYSRGVTLNVGVIAGGTKRNVVPDRASAWIDLRYDKPEEGQRIRAEIERIAALQPDPATRSELWGRLHRPPKLASPQVHELLARHRSAAEALGLDWPDPHHAGGGTDGSLMGAVGLPTLDSMGVIGSNAHTDGETAIRSSLTERAALASLLLRRLIESPALPARSGKVD